MATDRWWDSIKEMWRQPDISVRFFLLESKVEESLMEKILPRFQKKKKLVKNVCLSQSTRRTNICVHVRRKWKGKCRYMYKWLPWQGLLSCLFFHFGLLEKTTQHFKVDCLCNRTQHHLHHEVLEHCKSTHMQSSFCVTFNADLQCWQA